MVRKSIDLPLTMESAQALSAFTGSTDQPNQDLHDGISHLGDTQRHAIKLAYFYGMSYEEIANYRGESRNRIKSWLRRDLLRLKKCLE